jgi:diketogulonate reductase-like aldo/keto reductase
MKITDLQGTIELSNGNEMPYLGLGTFGAKDGKEVFDAVSYALEIGYRHIDTAAMYDNEEGIGKAIKASGIPREEIFLTSKLWNSDQGYENALKAFDESLNRLQTDYLDLYLIHWPVPGKYKDSWKALEHLCRNGKAKSIGVSNFLQHHLEDLMLEAESMPTVNQVEFHPYLVQPGLQNFCKDNGIQYEAWSPIMKGKATDIDLLEELADKYGKSPVQIVLRWDLQKGVVTIPKSAHKKRIKENADIFDFELSREDVKQIDALDKNERIGPDPNNVNF